MDLLPRLGIALFLCGFGVWFIVSPTKSSAFTGILGLLEEFLPQPFRSKLRRIVNTLFGLLLLLLAALIFFLAGNQTSEAPAGSAATSPSSASAASSAPATEADKP